MSAIVEFIASGKSQTRLASMQLAHSPPLFSLALAAELLTAEPEMLQQLELCVAEKPPETHTCCKEKMTSMTWLAGTLSSKTWVSVCVS